MKNIKWETGFPEKEGGLFLIQTKDNNFFLAEYNEGCQVFFNVDYNKHKLYTIDDIRRWSKLRVLFLPLKKEWYKMIESGEKKEEYRIIKPYWVERLCDFKDFTSELFYYTNDIEGEELVVYVKNFADIKEFDLLVFSYGYTKKRMAFFCDNIEIGEGREDWGALKGLEYFKIKIGERLI